MKKSISILLMFVMLFTTASGVFAADEMVQVTTGSNTGSYQKVNVFIDGKEMVGDMPAVIYGNSTMMPVRFITEGIGGEVEWNGKNQEVTVRLKSKVIVVKIGSTVAIVDGVTTYIPEEISPIAMNGRTMVPLRFISEEFGAEVGWNNETKTATVKTDRVGVDKPEEKPTELQTISKETINGREAIVVKNSGAVEYSHFKLASSNPVRLVVDIKNSNLAEGEKTYQLSTKIVEKVRTGNDGKDSRVVLDIKPGMEVESYEVQKSGSNLVIYAEGSQKQFYEVYQNEAYLGKFATKAEAIVEAKKWNNSTIVFEGAVVWKFADNVKQLYEVYQNKANLGGFATKAEAIAEAKKWNNSIIMFGGAVVWKYTDNIGSSNGKTIVIDPGHGGSDSGAVSYSGRYKEKDLALNVSLKLERELKARGYNVIMTRRTDVYPTLSQRAQVANDAKADAFISVHFNAFNSAATGLETFKYGTSYGNKGWADEQFAKSVHAGLMGANPGSVDRKVKEANYAVLRETKGIASLVELGFIDNPRDEARLVSDSYHETCAKGMADGVDNFFKK